MIGFTTCLLAIPQPTTSQLQKGAALGTACCVFAVGWLLFRCCLPVIPSFLPTASQGFCGEPDIGG
jgi:hypothetical protein